MLTDQDIDKLKQVFATKKDLERFATKDDLQSFATKDDLNNFATKDDLTLMKEELETNLKEHFDTKLDERTDAIVERIQTVIEMVGEAHDKSDKNDEEVKRQRIILGDHEERIQKLERSISS